MIKKNNKKCVKSFQLLGNLHSVSGQNLPLSSRGSTYSTHLIYTVHRSDLELIVKPRHTQDNSCLVKGLEP
jgi:hypothetical protein